jgi:hypothetical protein
VSTKRVFMDGCVYDASNASVRRDAAQHSRDGEGVERQVDQDPAVRISHPDDATDLSPQWAGEFPLDAYIAVSPRSEAALASITPRDSSLADGVRFRDQRRRYLNLCPPEGTSK